ncbi:aminoacyl--tRNA ligase-related protein [Paenibacillus sp. ALJ109b]|uniref:aminoacyl--tRNA ligase-related protein n=1 Tax=Paenibacillus sp. ALJ109b TaxID=2709068 RepID=UPI0013D65E5A|nr:aminoacyl--tRNA ligase-related protein [Paenibacillus sp. ALJ109b]NEU61595.1 amino acid--ACP ligase [Paenibacillus sp. ALJ109b]
MSIRVPVTGVLNEKQAHALTLKLAYSMEGICACTYDEINREIIVESENESNTEYLLGIIQTMILEEKEIRAMGSRLIKTQNQQKQQKQTYPTIDQTEIANYFDLNGTMKKELAVELYSIFDLIFQNISQNYNAKNRKYSSLIPREVMDVCKYVNYFPQNAYFVAELPHDYYVLKQVKIENDIENFVRLNEFMLSPAVCFHCYQELKNQEIKDSIVFTAEGSCFRHEAAWRVGQHRMNEFSMREIIYFGQPEFVCQIRNDILEEIWDLFNELGFCGRIETAHDPFYFPQDSSRAQHQMLADMKYELVVEIPNSDISFSIASFNNVKDTLCREFEITSTIDKKYLHSGCVAFGIDRWVYALMSTFGLDIQCYPQKIREYYRR